MKNIACVCEAKMRKRGQHASRRMQKKKRRATPVLKMCLSASRIARPHALFRDQARLRLIYRLRISGSRFHRERGKGFVMTARRRHSFALSPIACTVSTFWFSATLNLPTPRVSDVPIKRLQNPFKFRQPVVYFPPAQNACYTPS